MPVVGKSSYIVLLDGAPVHSEDTQLEYVGPYYSSGPTSTSTSSSVSSPPSEKRLDQCCIIRPWYPSTGTYCVKLQVGSLTYSPGNALIGTIYFTIAFDPRGCTCAEPALPYSLIYPTLYTIIQDVYRPPDNVSSPSPYPSGGLQTSRPRPVKIFSAIYHFRYPSNVRAGGSQSTAPSPLSIPGSRHSPSGSYSSHSSSSINYSASTSSSLSLSPMLALKPGLGSVGHASPIHPRSSSSPGMGHYGLQQQDITHAQGGYARYGAYPAAPPVSQAPVVSYTPTMNATLPDPLMLANEEDFFRFDDVDVSQGLSGDNGSMGGSSMAAGSMHGTSSGSNAQSPAPFFPKDSNSYVREADAFAYTDISTKGAWGRPSH
ncbi:hypothetical protein EDD16DRAFT_1901217 [Pisolithus croceorrhizus]|nr:hypothetical protein EDD16DRAFT_1901217 [Pisolithus croceorrhizus]